MYDAAIAAQVSAEDETTFLALQKQMYTGYLTCDDVTGNISKVAAVYKVP